MELAIFPDRFILKYLFQILLITIKYNNKADLLWTNLKKN